MKKLILSVISISLALITLVSTTYAWFSLNRNVYVDGIGFEVTGGENVLLSVDGIHWYQNLTVDKIKKATVAKYKGYSFNDNEGLVDSDNNLIEEEKIESIFNEKITLAPLTSRDGKVFTDLYNTTISESLGKFLTFDLYFGAEVDSLKEDTDIFFYHGGQKTLPDGTVVKPTRIAAATKSVSLKNELSSFDWTTGELVKYEAKSSILVNPANALRFSSVDNQDDTSKIYELDAYDEGNVINKGLGSYATSFTAYELNSNGSFMAKYDATKNAGFTYYNKLRDTKITELGYGDMPQTVRDFSTYENSKITTLHKDKGYTSKVTFNFWMEGWDADCVDGIGNSKITVSLSFTNSAEKTYEPVNVKFYQNLEDETPYIEYANANPGMYLLPALAPANATGKFKGWAVVKNDGSVDTNSYDETKTLKSLLASYDMAGAEELKLVALYN